MSWFQSPTCHTRLDNMWPDLGKSVLMSHFTPQIFRTNMRKSNFQSSFQWIQFVVYTFNYQNFMWNTLEVLQPLFWWHNELCNFLYFNVTLYWFSKIGSHIKRLSAYKNLVTIVISACFPSHIGIQKKAPSGYNSDEI